MNSGYGCPLLKKDGRWHPGLLQAQSRTQNANTLAEKVSTNCLILSSL